MATKTLWGVINADGKTDNGSGGFNVIRQETGEYIITFSPTFSGTPAIVGSQVNYGSTSENTLDNVIFPLVNESSATVLTGDSHGSKTNRSFSFIAIGLMSE